MRYYIKTCAIWLCVLAFPAKLTAEEVAGFLFVTFQSESTPMTEQVYFALSEDGRHWETLNDTKPVLVSDLGEKGVRDPYLIRSHDNTKFFLIATDLSINLNRNWTWAVRSGSRYIVIWETSDLVNWSAPRLVEVAPKDAGCTWAPEVIYDSENGEYLVFWASTTGRDEFRKHRIWAARTKDFVAFGEPFIFIEKPTTIIDTTIVQDSGNYYRFTKDEKFKAITMEVAPELKGPWNEIEDFSLAKLRGYEGPECYMLEPATDSKPATWCLILDNYARHRGYQPYITHDLASGHFEPLEGFQVPFQFRHGSVMPLTEAEYQRVKNAY
ncbi:glycoside hydrolase family 43 protein [Rhodopirellula sp. SWK7]|uniref:glycoside hydrolase family 43 protein n=1 Tax=Rhodopirellula sp. SWK7 TaxID=595460 RepID=UPI001181C4D7|nr:glycoside hydrolase family 43 protein [Rhodopirellula sp. SWK7]